LARANCSWVPTARIHGQPPPWILILQTPGVGDADKMAMLGGTAATLLGIKSP